MVFLECSVYIYVRYDEKFGGCWRSFLWLGQKVTDNNTHAQTVYAVQDDLTTSFCF